MKSGFSDTKCGERDCFINNFILLAALDVALWKRILPRTQVPKSLASYECTLMVEVSFDSLNLYKVASTLNKVPH